MNPKQDATLQETAGEQSRLQEAKGRILGHHVRLHRDVLQGLALGVVVGIALGLLAKAWAVGVGMIPLLWVLSSLLIRAKHDIAQMPDQPQDQWRFGVAVRQRLLRNLVVGGMGSAALLWLSGDRLFDEPNGTRLFYYSKEYSFYLNILMDFIYVPKKTWLVGVILAVDAWITGTILIGTVQAIYDWLRRPRAKGSAEAARHIEKIEQSNYLWIENLQKKLQISSAPVQPHTEQQNAAHQNEGLKKIKRTWVYLFRRFYEYKRGRLVVIVVSLALGFLGAQLVLDPTDRGYLHGRLEYFLIRVGVMWLQVGLTISWIMAFRFRVRWGASAKLIHETASNADWMATQIPFEWLRLYVRVAWVGWGLLLVKRYVGGTHPFNLTIFLFIIQGVAFVSCLFDPKNRRKVPQTWPDPKADRQWLLERVKKSDDSQLRLVCLVKLWRQGALEDEAIEAAACVTRDDAQSVKLLEIIQNTTADDQAMLLACLTDDSPWPQDTVAVAGAALVWSTATGMLKEEGARMLLHQRRGRLFQAPFLVLSSVATLASKYHVTELEPWILERLQDRVCAQDRGALVSAFNVLGSPASLGALNALVDDLNTERQVVIAARHAIIRILERSGDNFADGGTLALVDDESKRGALSPADQNHRQNE